MLSAFPKPKLMLKINDMINRGVYTNSARRTSFFISLFVL